MANVQAAERSSPERANSSPWLILAVIVVTLFAALTLSLLWPNDRYARYQQLSDTLHFRSIWAYERIVFDPAPIDIAIIGNSRLRAAVAAPKMQDELSKALGREVKVVNLSLPQEGRDAHYAMAKLLFEHRGEVKLVILSAIEEMPRKSHPAFANIADPIDTVTAPVLINPSYGENLAFAAFQQISLTAQSLFPRAFGIRGFSQEDYLGTDFDTTTSYMSATGNYVDKDTVYTAKDLRGPARKRIASITKPVLPAAFAATEYAVEHTYTRKIAEMARESGAELGFLYMPVFEHKDPLSQESFYTGFGSVFTASCIADRAEMFSDYGHMNHAGALEVTGHLASALARSGLFQDAPGATADAKSARSVHTICP